MDRKKSVEDISNNVIAFLDNIFDNHHLCDSEWCYKKCVEEDNTLPLGERDDTMKVGYYRYKLKDNELYEKMCKQYKFYNTEEQIVQFKYKLDTQ